MFLDSLHEVNRLVKQQLTNACLPVQYIDPHLEFLPTMEFAKSDHSTIQVKVPTYRFNLALNDIQPTPSGWANRIVQFVLDTANEFVKPRIYMSLAYLDYSPRLGLNPQAALSFDIAIWEYDGDEMHWLELNEPDAERKGHTFDFSNSSQPPIQSQSHQLLKTNPFEVNIWTANILRDIGFLSVAGEGASASQYMIKLEQELLASARNAADTLNNMQKAASAHDMVLALFRCKQYEQAAKYVSAKLGREVTIHTDGLNYLMIDDRLYKADQAFALFVGLDTPCINPYDLEEQTTADNFWKWREPTDEDRAKAKALGVSIDLDTKDKQ